MVTDNKNLQETIYKLSLHTLLTCTCVQACCLYICICTMLHHCGPLWPRTDCKTCRFILMSKQPWGPKASQSIGHVMAVKICYRGCQQHTHTHHAHVLWHQPTTLAPSCFSTLHPHSSGQYPHCLGMAGGGALWSAKWCQKYLSCYALTEIEEEFRGHPILELTLVTSFKK